MGVNKGALVFGIVMAMIDVGILGLLREAHESKRLSFGVLAFASVVYALQPFLFYKALEKANMVTMNILWDLSSDVLVTIMGFVIFREILQTRQLVGLALAFVAIYLLVS